MITKVIENSLTRLSCAYAGGHESLDFRNGISKVIETEHAANSGRGSQLDDINLHKNKKLRESKSGNVFIYL